MNSQPILADYPNYQGWANDYWLYRFLQNRNNQDTDIKAALVTLYEIAQLYPTNTNKGLEHYNIMNRVAAVNLFNLKKIPVELIPQTLYGFTLPADIDFKGKSNSIIIYVVMAIVIIAGIYFFLKNRK